MNDFFVPPDVAAITALIDFVDPAIEQQGWSQSGAIRDVTPIASGLRYAFGQPREYVVAQTTDQVAQALDTVQALARQGAWCVGYVRYEAASAFDTALLTHCTKGSDAPLVSFAAYDKPLPWPAHTAWPQLEGGAWSWINALQRAQFDAAVAHIHAGIAAGDYYQVNYTAPLHGVWQSFGTTASGVMGGVDASALPPAVQDHLRALALFAAMQRAQPGGYAAYLRAADAIGESVLSVSPELFFDWRTSTKCSTQAGMLHARPMKGTAPRGITPAQDMAAEQMLRNAPKERAENVMIVDLLRNDMSRIAEPHSVQVPQLFATQALPAVWQMTSDVIARTRPGITLAQVFQALFPCGSVTGAPKAQSMRAIKQLEPDARGVYCGALGVVHPTKDGIRAVFNVPIRTVVLSRSVSTPVLNSHPVPCQDGVDALVARCGIGSGITADAHPDAEWAEWSYKKAFLDRASYPFEVLETLALEAGQYRHRYLHLARMEQAARHFGVPWQPQEINACLDGLASQHLKNSWRVRLLLSAAGKPYAQAFALMPTVSPVQLQWAQQPLMQAHSEFVRFKTTRRAHYDAFTPTNKDVFDTILFNPAGEITECTRGNIAMHLRGQWVTPPLECGLLPGVGRALALQKGDLTEAIVRLVDVPFVQEWAFINSLRGWLPAKLVNDAPPMP